MLLAGAKKLIGHHSGGSLNPLSCRKSWSQRLSWPPQSCTLIARKHAEQFTFAPSLHYAAWKCLDQAPYSSREKGKQEGETWTQSGYKNYSVEVAPVSELVSIRNITKKSCSFLAMWPVRPNYLWPMKLLQRWLLHHPNIQKAKVVEKSFIRCTRILWHSYIGKYKVHTYKTCMYIAKTCIFTHTDVDLSCIIANLYFIDKSL